MSRVEYDKFLIILCTKCKNSLLAKDKNNTRRCPYCGNNIKITHLVILASTDNGTTAKKMIADYKNRSINIKSRV